MKQEKDFTTYEVRAYRVNEDYSIECHDETKENGTVFAYFYITNGTRKMFCVGFQIHEPEKEEDYVDSIFYEYINLFEEECDVLNDYYDQKIEEMFKNKEEENGDKE